MTQSSSEGAAQNFRGLRGILRFNWQKIQSFSIRQRVFLAVFFFAWVSILTFVWLDARGKPRTSFDEDCKAKCSPLPHRVEVKLLNPFIGADQRRNVRSTACVCGTAP